MANRSLTGVLKYLRKPATAEIDPGLSDRELLERYIKAQDESAFTVLIERHGPMVFGICRRGLPNFQDAEDACQACFLVLARKAASVRKKTSLSSWLHGVAYRLSVKLQRDSARRKGRELGVEVQASSDPAAELSWREGQAILDDELQRLPERFRAPLILCYLEGLTRDEAAQRLCISSGILHGRLERGRNLLGERLTRRGLTLSAVMSTAVLGVSASQAALAPTFFVSLTKAAKALATGQPLAESVIATKIIALSQEAMKAMFLTKVKCGTATVLCAGLLAALIGSPFASPGIAQETKPNVPEQESSRSGLEKAENDMDFIRRISKDLRGTDPTPAEIHFFVSSKETGRRQKLIDLFIEERQARTKKWEEVLRARPTAEEILDGAKERKRTDKLPDVQPNQLVGFLNERADRLRSLEFNDTRMRVSGKGIRVPATQDGNLAVMQPRMFRMVNSGRLASAKLDIGSNDKEFWFYVAAPGDAPMYAFASHEDFASGRAKMPGGFPLEPDWVMHALGMTHLSSTHDYSVAVNDRDRTYTLSWTSATPGGACRKEIVFDADGATGTKPQVKKHVIRNAKTNALIAVAEIKSAQTERVGIIQGSQLPAAIQYPTHIVFKWEDPHFEMDLNLDKATLNASPIDDSSRRGLFARPEIKGAKAIDLTRQEFK
jgi:RNA polymerase sigma factor (sigma-70 family)